MHILAIYGSPRRNGNTSILLETFLSAIPKTLATGGTPGSSAGETTGTLDAPDDGFKIERIRLVGDYRPCLGCDACVRGSCIQKDDMQYLYPKLASADVIVVASPIYFYGLPARLKAVVDRGQLFFNKKYVRKETWRAERGKGFFLSCGATNGGHLFHGAVLTAKYWFDALDFLYCGQVLVREVDHAGAIRDRPAALREAEQLASILKPS